MRYLLCAAAMLYALLSMLAAGTQFRSASKKDALVLMLLGGALMLLAAGAEIAALFEGWPVVLAGGALICIAALLNGRRSDHFHPAHHVIRLAVTLLLTVGFYML